ncbi:unnamed protein product [Owenia fusiformis]|uniref:Chitinase n=1 Tax=Owenia fusiformis TaxID=6347 RepID=A0A8S4Q1L4_OWEFU|nr:unnamed protein product [Owenia fusiformis]
MANNATKRRNFVKNSIAFLRRYRFDGLDLDWEYPAQRDSTNINTDKVAFVKLCKDLKNGFQREARSSRKPRLLLAAAVGCGPRNIHTSYDVRSMSRHLDFINLMTYDLAGQWDGRTGIHGALHGAPGDASYELNQEWSVNRYIELGAPRKKLVLGIPMYGRSFKLTSGSSDVGAPAAFSGAIAGPYTVQSGIMAYYEVCAKIKAGWEYKFDPLRMDSYSYNGTDWVGFSDKTSVAKKAEFIKAKRLGGAMIWSLDFDNFKRNALCNTDKEDFTLLKTINKVLDGIVETTTAATVTTTTEPEDVELKKVCYYTSWSQYRKGAGRFLPEDIDPSLCTHIIYAFAYVDTRINSYSYSGLKAYEYNDVQMYESINALKKQNPSLKTLLAVGGWNHGSKPFSYMANRMANRKNFVTNSIKYLKRYGFDGLSLDWAYPGQRDSNSSTDKAAFVELCKDMKAGFEKEAKSSAGPRLILTAAVGCGPKNIETSYDVPGISRYLDFINLMAYDLAGQFRTGIHGALHSGQGDASLELNQEWSVKKFIELGAPKKKLVLGIPLFGRSYKLRTANSAIGAPATTKGAIGGPYTVEPGFMAYYEVCAKLKAGWRYKFDSQRGDPYAYSGYNWVGFSDKTSVAKKAEFIIDEDLGGAMIWALDLDNFNKDSLCNTDTEDFPLLKTINKVFDTADQRKLFKCPSTPVYRKYQTSDCTKYVTCLNGENYGTKPCRSGLLFSESKQRCISKTYVKCDDTTTVKPTVTTVPPTPSTKAFTSPTTTTVSPITATQAKEDRHQRKSSEVFKCPSGPSAPVYRMYQDPKDCTKFITCLSGTNFGTQSCPSSLLFSEPKQLCDNKENVKCV